MNTATLPRLAAVLVLGASLLAPMAVEAGDRHRDRGERYEDRHEVRHDHRRGDWNDRDYREGYRDGRRAERRDDRREARRWDRYDDRRDRRVVYREVHYAPPYAYGPPRHYAPPSRHYGPPRWARGHRIHDYRWAPTYVVVDYHRHGLRHPPRGYHWRRDDRGDWLLVAIATGIIADVVFH